MTLSTALFLQPAPLGTARGSHPPAPSDAFSTAGLTVSPLAAFAAAAGLSDISIHANQTHLAYRKDGSLALRAVSRLDVSLRVRETAVGITLPAIALGLDKESPLFRGSAISLTLETWQNEVETSRQATSRLVKPLRNIEDILRDLGKALNKILRQPGSKGISVALDEEAVQALIADAGIHSVLEEISALINLINTLHASSGGDQYHITLSGRGSPYIEAVQPSQVEAESSRIRLHLTILPPADKANPSADKEALP